MSPDADVHKPLVIVAGGDALASTVADRLAKSRTCQVRTYWNDDPADSTLLLDAGIAVAAVLMAVDEDDQTNLEIAVEARRLNPGLRIVLRQFKRALAKKIEMNLANCSVVSLSSHSAATYAAVAIEPSAFLGMQFPQDAGPLYAFLRRKGRDFGVGGMTVAQAEDRIGRIIAIDSERPTDERSICDEDQVVAFGPADRLSAAVTKRNRLNVFRDLTEGLKMLAGEIDPLIRGLTIVGVIIFAVATAFFVRAIHLPAIAAAYFVVTTMTTTGYGDISLAASKPYVQIAGIVLMILSVILLNLTFAFFAAAVIRAQLGMMQGFRSIKERGHIVVVGCGRIGMRVVDYLLKAGAIVVVVDVKPDDNLIRMARSRSIKLLAGDGRQDEALDACSIENAHSVVAATDEDTNNLEIALGARARQANIPAIVRITSGRFAESVADAFNIRRTFSPITLAAPTFCDLAFSARARGRIKVGTEDYLIEEVAVDHDRGVDETVLATADGTELIMRKAPSSLRDNQTTRHATEHHEPTEQARY